MSVTELPFEAPGLHEALRSLGLELASICSRATQIFVFGSHACGCAQARSDWDLLCIGDGRTRRTQKVDLIWISRETLQSSTWLDSELASHVGVYGRLVHGDELWRPNLDALPGDAASAKARRIQDAARTLTRVWSRFSPPYQRKHWVRLRRELQRHALLRQERAIVPTAWLDADWSAEVDRFGAFRQLCEGADLRLEFIQTLARTHCEL